MDIPVPPVCSVVPAETPNIQVGQLTAAIDGAPEEHRLVLPLIGDEVLIGQQVVEDVGVQEEALILILYGPNARELEIIELELELSALYVLFNTVTLRHVGIGITVDDGVVGLRVSHYSSPSPTKGWISFIYIDERSHRRRDC